MNRRTLFGGALLALGAFAVASAGARTNIAGADCASDMAGWLTYLRPDPFNETAHTGRLFVSIGVTTNSPMVAGARAGSGWLSIGHVRPAGAVADEEVLKGRFSLLNPGATPAGIEHEITINARTGEVSISRAGTTETFTGTCTTGVPGMTGVTTSQKIGAIWSLSFFRGTAPK